MTLRLCFTEANQHIEEFTAANNDSRESTIVTLDASTDGNNSDSDCGVDGDLPTFEDLFSQTKATRCTAMSTPDQKHKTKKRLICNRSLKGGIPVGEPIVEEFCWHLTTAQAKLQ